MSQDKMESRRDFMKKLGKIAGASLAATPFMAENLCFSKEELDKFEKDLDNIQIKGIKREQDERTSTCYSNYRIVGSCECYSNCGSNFHKRANCDCYSNCGSNFHLRNLCDCYGSCGGDYAME